MEKKKFRSKKGAERVSLVLIYAILIIISLIWLIPFLMLIILSFRGEQVGMSVDYLFPKRWSFTHHVRPLPETQFPPRSGKPALQSVIEAASESCLRYG